MNEKLELLLSKFNESLKTWGDLPNYVYTEEYKNAFIEFCKPRLEMDRDIEALVIMTLDHEIGNKRPYFGFNRGDEIKWN